MWITGQVKAKTRRTKKNMCDTGHHSEERSSWGQGTGLRQVPPNSVALLSDFHLNWSRIFLSKVRSVELERWLSGWESWDKVDLQDPGGSSQPSVASVPCAPIPSSDFQRYQVCLWCMWTHLADEWIWADIRRAIYFHLNPHPHVPK